VPRSAEPADFDPRIRAQALAKSAAFRAAALSGTMSLPPGPLGMMTVLPDLLSVWRLQQQLVADIAAAFGKSDLLTSETMVICLFQHGSSTLTSDLLSRSGNRVLVRRVAVSTLHQLLGKISIRVTQRLAAKGFSRWLPLIGALGVGAYAYYETSQVAANAIELFAKDVALDLAVAEENWSETAERRSQTSAQKKSRGTRRHSRATSASTKTKRSGKRRRTPKSAAHI
jgi:hypothetical protein